MIHGRECVDRDTVFRYSDEVHRHPSYKCAKEFFSVRTFFAEKIVKIQIVSTKQARFCIADGKIQSECSIPRNPSRLRSKFPTIDIYGFDIYRVLIDGF